MQVPSILLGESRTRRRDSYFLITVSSHPARHLSNHHIGTAETWAAVAMVAIAGRLATSRKVWGLNLRGQRGTGRRLPKRGSAVSVMEIGPASMREVQKCKSAFSAEVSSFARTP